MNTAVLTAVIETTISIFIEGIILAFVFQHISNLAGDKQQQHLQTEMNNIEKQNKFDFEQLQKEIRDAKTDILNQIKETAQNKERPPND